jgi:hypothetical protein
MASSFLSSPCVRMPEIVPSIRFTRQVNFTPYNQCPPGLLSDGVSANTFPPDSPQLLSNFPLAKVQVPTSPTVQLDPYGLVQFHLFRRLRPMVRLPRSMARPNFPGASSPCGRNLFASCRAPPTVCRRLLWKSFFLGFSEQPLT